MSEEMSEATASSAKGTGMSEFFMAVPAEKGIDTPEPKTARLSWKGSGASEGQSIAYDCTAGHLDVRADTGKLLGKMFSLTYVAADTPDAGPSRPVTFCYNGGPGCASVPINFGGIGPRRVKTDGVSHLAVPIEVEDNPYTLLRQSSMRWEPAGPASPRTPTPPRSSASTATPMRSAAQSRPGSRRTAAGRARSTSSASRTARCATLF